ncbi:MAG: transglutaminase-like cysteine peptidase, partial [Methylomonas sp.]|nr:transglutaminase-like cysteine peptidase [Methylomonas sp.]
KSASEIDKLRLVNDFFNQNIRFVSDMMLWLKEDYWATPLELLAQGAGDCEDYSIAKYFTLLELGVDEQKLRITYVKAIELNQAHMVLTYFETPHSVPLVLDNLEPKISLATERSDLEPVYSFNGSGLWLAKIKSSGLQVGDAERLNPWTDLKRRMLEKTN